MRSTWTDSRLDDLNGRVTDLSNRVDAGFARVDSRIDSLQRSMTQAVVAISVGMLAGFGGLAGLIATQL